MPIGNRYTMAQWLRAQVNIVITGDHGMALINHTFTSMTSAWTAAKICWSWTTPNLNAFVNNASNWPVVLQRLRAIPNVRVYRLDDIPDRWH